MNNVEQVDYYNPLGGYHRMREMEHDSTRNTSLWSIIVVIGIIAIFYFWNQAKMRNLDVANTLGGLTQSTTETQAQTALLRNQLRYDEQFAFWQRPAHIDHCGSSCCGHGGHGHFGGCGGFAPAYGCGQFYGGGCGSAYGYPVPVNGGLNGPFNFSHGYPVPEFKFKKVQEYEACGNPRIKETEVV